MGVEQHLVGLEEIGSYEEGTAVAELEVCHLQLGAHAIDNRPVFAPVKLERLTRRERQRHERALAAHLLLAAIIITPASGKGRNAPIGAVKAQAHQIGMELLDRALLLARPAHLSPEPDRQPLDKRIQLAWPLRYLELRLDFVRSQILTDGVAG